MTHRPDDYVPTDFEDPLVILPHYVLSSLKNMEAKQPRLVKLRIEKIRGLATMFDSFLRWQALNHPNFKHSWGEKPAMQLTQHCHFLQDVISGRVLLEVRFQDALLVNILRIYIYIYEYLHTRVYSILYM